MSWWDTTKKWGNYAYDWFARKEERERRQEKPQKRPYSTIDETNILGRKIRRLRQEYETNRERDERQRERRRKEIANTYALKKTEQEKLEVKQLRINLAASGLRRFGGTSGGSKGESWFQTALKTGGAIVGGAAGAYAAGSNSMKQNAIQTGAALTGGATAGAATAGATSGITAKELQDDIEYPENISTDDDVIIEDAETVEEGPLAGPNQAGRGPANKKDYGRIKKINEARKRKQSEKSAEEAAAKKKAGPSKEELEEELQKALETPLPEEDSDLESNTGESNFEEEQIPEDEMEADSTEESPIITSGNSGSGQNAGGVVMEHKQVDHDWYQGTTDEKTYQIRIREAVKFGAWKDGAEGTTVDAEDKWKDQYGDEHFYESQMCKESFILPDPSQSGLKKTNNTMEITRSKNNIQILPGSGSNNNTTSPIKLRKAKY